jgi:peptidoglycan hydrolase CwlO-like protein
MTRTIKVLSTLALGGMLFSATACEDTVCKEALAKATTEKAEVQKKVDAQTAEINGLRARLAAADQATAAARKALDEAKAAAAKPAEPAAPAEKPAKGKKK